MELITAIALLCQINIGGRWVDALEISEKQKTCQKELAKCVLDKTGSFKYNAEKDLLKCITKRK